jgi:hypothetical protein
MKEMAEMAKANRDQTPLSGEFHDTTCLALFRSRRAINHYSHTRWHSQPAGVRPAGGGWRELIMFDFDLSNQLFRRVEQ